MYTGSRKAKQVLDAFDATLPKFVKIMRSTINASSKNENAKRARCIDGLTWVKRTSLWEGLSWQAGAGGQGAGLGGCN